MDLSNIILVSICIIIVFLVYKIIGNKSKIINIENFNSIKSNHNRRVLEHFTTITDDNFKEACQAYCSNPTEAEETYGPISEWDTSQVTDMSEAFKGCSTFNEDISEWDTSSVTKMKDMFRFASSFNGDISGWNTSSVSDMHGLFLNASSFNGDISGWNTSSLTDTSYMFIDCSIITRDYNFSYAAKFHLQYPPSISIVQWSAAKVAFKKPQPFSLYPFLVI